MNEQPSASDVAGGDNSLVVRAKTDRAAFGLLFDRYYPRILRYCLRRLVNRSVAEDVTSEVFLQVATHLRDFIGHTETDFRCWLFRIATNAVHAHARQSQRRAELRQMASLVRPKDSGCPTRTSSTDYDPLDWPTIQRAIAELDEREQTIVSLRFFAELSHEDIAAVIGGTAGAVRTMVSRTLARLRERFHSTIEQK